MQKPKKLPRDANSLAARIVAISTAQEATPVENETPDTKNPAAVALGRLGGLKGGRARAEKLSSEKRKEIAQRAAASRWARRTQQ